MERSSPTAEKPPLLILAGSDRRPGPVPAGSTGLHFVVGYKGADLKLGDRCLVQLLLERVRTSGVFGEVYLAGPSRVYAGLVDCAVIDTDGHLGENLRAGIERVLEVHGRDALLGIMACDILPEAGELAALGAEILTAASAGQRSEGREAEPGPQVGLVISMIRAGAELGPSGWKPRYGLRLRPGGDLVPLLPGHLGLLRPSMLRMPFVYRLLQLLYHERNREYEARKRYIVLRVLGTLIRSDLRNLFLLLAPTLTYRVLRHGLGTVLRWRRGELDLDGLALGLAAVGIRRRHFRRWRGRCVAVVLSSSLSFARDLDTREELQELAARLER